MFITVIYNFNVDSLHMSRLNLRRVFNFKQFIYVRLWDFYFIFKQFHWRCSYELYDFMLYLI